MQAATDENIRTWWSAATNAPGQWIEIDLQKPCDVRAVQINFADEGLLAADQTLTERMIDTRAQATRWLLEGSLDGKAYFVIEDKRDADTDLPHDLIVREEGLPCRFLRLTVDQLPYRQVARVSGLRVFGLCKGEFPQKAVAEAKRLGDLDMLISWRAENAVGVNILWGCAPDKLYHSYLVYGKPHQRIGALCRGEGVYLRVDAFNECGITKGDVLFLPSST